MNTSRLCIANVQYKKPTASDAKRQTGLLRYLTYRDSRYAHITQAEGMDRWVDHGLGGSVRDVATQCDAFRSPHVLAFTLVFNPNPDVTALVPLDQREAFVQELTETALSTFFEARGIEGGVEHSFVLHHRQSDNPEAPGQHDPHTHVILPGTYFDENTGQREPLFFSRNKQVNHIELLHRSTEQSLCQILDRRLGREWVQQYEALEQAREQQRKITETASHSKLTDEHGRQWETWIGQRRTDERHTAVGYYRYFPHNAKAEQTTFKPEDLDLEFRPLAENLPHEQAAKLAAWTAQSMKDHPTQGFDEMLDFITEAGGLDNDTRLTWLKEMAKQLEAVHLQQPVITEREPDVEPERPSYASRERDIDFF